MPPPDAAEAAAMARLIGGVSLLEPLPVAPNVFTLNTVGAPAARGLTPAGPGAASQDQTLTATRATAPSTASHTAGDVAALLKPIADMRFLPSSVQAFPG